MSAPAAYTGPADRSLQIDGDVSESMESPPVETLANLGSMECQSMASDAKMMHVESEVILGEVISLNSAERSSQVGGGLIPEGAVSAPAANSCPADRSSRIDGDVVSESLESPPVETLANVGSVDCQPSISETNMMHVESEVIVGEGNVMSGRKTRKRRSKRRRQTGGSKKGSSQFGVDLISHENASVTNVDSFPLDRSSQIIGDVSESLQSLPVQTLANLGSVECQSMVSDANMMHVESEVILGEVISVNSAGRFSQVGGGLIPVEAVSAPAAYTCPADNRSSRIDVDVVSESLESLPVQALANVGSVEYQSTVADANMTHMKSEVILGEVISVNSAERPSQVGVGLIPEEAVSAPSAYTCPADNGSSRIDGDVVLESLESPPVQTLVNVGSVECQSTVPDANMTHGESEDILGEVMSVNSAERTSQVGGGLIPDKAVSAPSAYTCPADNRSSRIDGDVVSESLESQPVQTLANVGSVECQSTVPDANMTHVESEVILGEVISVNSVERSSQVGVGLIPEGAVSAPAANCCPVGRSSRIDGDVVSESLESPPVETLANVGSVDCQPSISETNMMHVESEVIVGEGNVMSGRKTRKRRSKRRRQTGGSKKGSSQFGVDLISHESASVTNADSFPLDRSSQIIGDVSESLQSLPVQTLASLGSVECQSMVSDANMMHVESEVILGEVISVNSAGRFSQVGGGLIPVEAVSAPAAYTCPADNGSSRIDVDVVSESLESLPVQALANVGSVEYQSTVADANMTHMKSEVILGEVISVNSAERPSQVGVGLIPEEAVSAPSAYTCPADNGSSRIDGDVVLESLESPPVQTLVNVGSVECQSTVPDANMTHGESEDILGEVMSVNSAERTSQVGGGLIPDKAVSAPSAYTCPADNRSSRIDGDVVSESLESQPVQTLANVGSVECQSTVPDANMTHVESEVILGEVISVNSVERSSQVGVGLIPEGAVSAPAANCCPVGRSSRIDGDVVSESLESPPVETLANVGSVDCQPSISETNMMHVESEVIVGEGNVMSGRKTRKRRSKRRRQTGGSKKGSSQFGVDLISHESASVTNADSFPLDRSSQIIGDVSESLQSLPVQTLASLGSVECQSMVSDANMMHVESEVILGEVISVNSAGRFSQVGGGLIPEEAASAPAAYTCPADNGSSRIDVDVVSESLESLPVQALANVGSVEYQCTVADANMTHMESEVILGEMISVNSAERPSQVGVGLIPEEAVSAPSAYTCPADNRSSRIDGDVVSESLESPPVQTLANVGSVECQSTVPDANMTHVESEVILGEVISVNSVERSSQVGVGLIPEGAVSAPAANCCPVGRSSRIDGDVVSESLESLPVETLANVGSVDCHPSISETNMMHVESEVIVGEGNVMSGRKTRKRRSKRRRQTGGSKKGSSQFGVDLISHENASVTNADSFPLDRSSQIIGDVSESLQSPPVQTLASWGSVECQSMVSDANMMHVESEVILGEVISVNSAGRFPQVGGGLIPVEAVSAPAAYTCPADNRSSRIDVDVVSESLESLPVQALADVGSVECQSTVADADMTHMESEVILGEVISVNSADRPSHVEVGLIPEEAVSAPSAYTCPADNGSSRIDVDVVSESLESLPVQTLANVGSVKCHSTVADANMTDVESEVILGVVISVNSAERSSQAEGGLIPEEAVSAPAAYTCLADSRSSRIDVDAVSESLESPPVQTLANVGSVECQSTVPDANMMHVESKVILGEVMSVNSAERTSQVGGGRIPEEAVFAPSAYTCPADNRSSRIDGDVSESLESLPVQSLANVGSVECQSTVPDANMTHVESEVIRGEVISVNSVERSSQVGVGLIPEGAVSAPAANCCPVGRSSRIDGDVVSESLESPPVETLANVGSVDCQPSISDTNMMHAESEVIVGEGNVMSGGKVRKQRSKRRGRSGGSRRKRSSQFGVDLISHENASATKADSFPLDRSSQIIGDVSESLQSPPVQTLANSGSVECQSMVSDANITHMESEVILGEVISVNSAERTSQVGGGLIPEEAVAAHSTYTCPAGNESSRIDGDNVSESLESLPVQTLANVGSVECQSSVPDDNMTDMESKVILGEVISVNSAEGSSQAEGGLIPEEAASANSGYSCPADNGSSRIDVDVVSESLESLPVQTVANVGSVECQSIVPDANMLHVECEVTLGEAISVNSAERPSQVGVGLIPEEAVSLPSAYTCPADNGSSRIDGDVVSESLESPPVQTLANVGSVQRQSTIPDANTMHVESEVILDEVISVNLVERHSQVGVGLIPEETVSVPAVNSCPVGTSSRIDGDVISESLESPPVETLANVGSVDCQPSISDTNMMHVESEVIVGEGNVMSGGKVRKQRSKRRRHSGGSRRKRSSQFGVDLISHENASVTNADSFPLDRSSQIIANNRSSRIEVDVVSESLESLPVQTLANVVSVECQSTVPDVNMTRMESELILGEVTSVNSAERSSRAEGGFIPGEALSAPSAYTCPTHNGSSRIENDVVSESLEALPVQTLANVGSVECQSAVPDANMTDMESKVILGEVISVNSAEGSSQAEGGLIPEEAASANSGYSCPADNGSSRIDVDVVSESLESLPVQTVANVGSVECQSIVPDANMLHVECEVTLGEAISVNSAERPSQVGVGLIPEEAVSLPSAYTCPADNGSSRIDGDVVSESLESPPVQTLANVGSVQRQSTIPDANTMHVESEVILGEVISVNLVERCSQVGVGLIPEKTVSAPAANSCPGRTSSRIDGDVISESLESPPVETLANVGSVDCQPSISDTNMMHVEYEVIVGEGNVMSGGKVRKQRSKRRRHSGGSRRKRSSQFGVDLISHENASVTNADSFPLDRSSQIVANNRSSRIEVDVVSESLESLPVQTLANVVSVECQSTVPDVNMTRMESEVILGEVTSVNSAERSSHAEGGFIPGEALSAPSAYTCPTHNGSSRIDNDVVSESLEALPVQTLANVGSVECQSSVPDDNMTDMESKVILGEVISVNSAEGSSQAEGGLIPEEAASANSGYSCPADNGSSRIDVDVVSESLESLPVQTVANVGSVECQSIVPDANMLHVECEVTLGEAISVNSAERPSQVGVGLIPEEAVSLPSAYTCPADNGSSRIDGDVVSESLESPPVQTLANVGSVQRQSTIPDANTMHVESEVILDEVISVNLVERHSQVGVGLIPEETVSVPAANSCPVGTSSRIDGDVISESLESPPVETLANVGSVDCQPSISDTNMMHVESEVIVGEGNVMSGGKVRKQRSKRRRHSGGSRRKRSSQFGVDLISHENASVTNADSFPLDRSSQIIANNRSSRIEVDVVSESLESLPVQTLANVVSVECQSTVPDVNMTRMESEVILGEVTSVNSAERSSRAEGGFIPGEALSAPSAYTCPTHNGSSRIENDVVSESLEALPVQTLANVGSVECQSAVPDANMTDMESKVILGEVISVNSAEGSSQAEGGLIPEEAASANSGYSCPADNGSSRIDVDVVSESLESLPVQTVANVGSVECQSIVPDANMLHVECEVTLGEAISVNSAERPSQVGVGLIPEEAVSLPSAYTCPADNGSSRIDGDVVSESLESPPVQTLANVGSVQRQSTIPDANTMHVESEVILGEVISVNLVQRCSQVGVGLIPEETVSAPAANSCPVGTSSRIDDDVISESLESPPVETLANVGSVDCQPSISDTNMMHVESEVIVGEGNVMSGGKVRKQRSKRRRHSGGSRRKRSSQFGVDLISHENASVTNADSFPLDRSSQIIANNRSSRIEVDVVSESLESLPVMHVESEVIVGESNVMSGGKMRKRRSKRREHSGGSRRKRFSQFGVDPVSHENTSASNADSFPLDRSSQIIGDVSDVSESPPVQTLANSGSVECQPTVPDANVMHMESEVILGEVISVNSAERFSQVGGGLIPEEAVPAPTAYTCPADSRSSRIDVDVVSESLESLPVQTLGIVGSVEFQSTVPDANMTHMESEVILGEVISVNSAERSSQAEGDLIPEEAVSAPSTYTCPAENGSSRIDSDVVSESLESPPEQTLANVGSVECQSTVPDANMMHVESEAILGEVISVNLAERSSQFGGGLIPEEAVSAPAAYTFPADSRSSQIDVDVVSESLESLPVETLANVGSVERQTTVPDSNVTHIDSEVILGEVISVNSTERCSQVGGGPIPKEAMSATAANSCPADRSSLIDGDVVSDLVELPPVQTLANVDSVEFQSAVSEANIVHMESKVVLGEVISVNSPVRSSRVGSGLIPKEAVSATAANSCPAYRSLQTDGDVVAESVESPPVKVLANVGSVECQSTVPDANMMHVESEVIVGEGDVMSDGKMRKRRSKRRLYSSGSRRKQPPQFGVDLISDENAFATKAVSAGNSGQADRSLHIDGDVVSKSQESPPVQTSPNLGSDDFQPSESDTNVIHMESEGFPAIGEGNVMA